jgi:hypothetical protein
MSGTSESVRRTWAALTEKQRSRRRQAIREGIARRVVPASPDVHAGDRCGVCGLLQPHECMDAVEVIGP